MHLMAHACGVDHGAAVLGDKDLVHLHFAGFAVHGHIDHPGGPGCAIAGELAVVVAGIGKATALDQTLIIRRWAAAGRAFLPVALLLGFCNQRHCAWVLQVAQAVLDRVGLGDIGTLVNPGFMREHIGQGRYAAHPRCTHQRHSILRDHAHMRVLILRDGRAVTHLLQIGLVGHLAGQNQGQCCCVVGGVAGAQLVARDSIVFIQATAHADQLSRTLGLPCSFLLAHQLHAHGLAHGSGHQHGVRAHIVGAVAAIAARSFHAGDVDVVRLHVHELGDVLAHIVRVLRTRPDLNLTIAHFGNRAGGADGAVDVIWPDILAAQRCLDLFDGLQRAFVFTQQAVALGVIAQRLVQAAQRQIGQACPVLPHHLELVHGGNGLLLALGHHAHKVALNHDFDNAGQVRDGFFIDRNQAGTQRCRCIRTAVGWANHATMQHAGHAQIVDIGQRTQHLVGNVHALHGLSDVFKAGLAQLDLGVHLDLQILPLHQLAIAKALATCNHKALLGGDALCRNAGLLAGQLDQHLAHLRGCVAHGQRRDLDGVRCNRGSEVWCAGGMAQHHGHCGKVHIQLIGHQLTQSRAYTGAQIHVAVIGRDRAVSTDGDKAVHQLGRRYGEQALGSCFRGGLRHQQMAACDGADHQHAAGLEQLATGQLRLIVLGKEFHDQAAFCSVEGMAALRP